MNFNEPFFMVSAYQDELSKEVNEFNFNKIKSALNLGEVSYVTALGNLNKEWFVIYNLSNERMVKEIAKAFNQSGYLIIHNDKYVEHLLLSGLNTGLGYLIKASSIEVKKYDNWFKLNNNKEDYYVIK